MLIGGFLGAGKTTCLGALVAHFQGLGKRVGVITNDQGVGLVDTQRVQAGSSSSWDNDAHHGQVREITGGCFCCKAGELVSALQEMAATEAPEIFLAEPVGSCTDLMATVILPLRQVYRLPLVMAPMSVVVDARRLHDLYFAKPGKADGFSRDVRYIFMKQLEEAEILVLNKWDLLNEKERAKLTEKLGKDWPEKTVIPISARKGEGMERWYELLEATSAQPQEIMEVDYERYGVGEALLGWYNAELVLDGVKMIDGNALLMKLVGAVQTRLEAAGVEIAHFKVSFERGGGILPPSQHPATNPHGPETIAKAHEAEEGGAPLAASAAARSKAWGQNAPATLAVLHVVRAGEKPEFSTRLAQKLANGKVLINLRAEGDPELLAKIMAEEIANFPLAWKEKAAFRPGQPVPVHRVTKLEQPSQSSHGL